jgi:hypothetical protein
MARGVFRALVALAVIAGIEQVPLAAQQFLPPPGTSTNLAIQQDYTPAQQAEYLQTGVQEVLPTPLAGNASQPAPPLPNDAPAPPAFPVPNQPVDNGGNLSQLGPAAPAEVHGGAFLGSIEYLLLQPRRRALDYAILAPVNNGSPIGSVVEAPWNTTSGFRVGGGYRLPGDGWDFGVYYTYLFMSDRGSSAAPPGGVLIPTLSQPVGVVATADTASVNTRLQYYVLDLEFGKRCHPSDCLSLWLGGGGRFAWIRQDLNVIYDGQSSFAATVNSPVHFNGAGLRFGADGQWALGCGFGVYARAFGSLMTGDFKTTLVETNGAGAQTLVDVSDHFHKVVPVAELGLGLAWQGEMCRFRLGYEMTNWFGMVDSPDIVHEFNKLSRRTSDLSLDGLAIELQFTY